MSVKTVEFLVGDRQLRLTGDHISYLDGIEAAGDTPLIRPLMRLIKSLPSGATYLDVGANIGLTAIGAATARPDLHVVAFEPVPSNADFLTQNVRANSANNCTVVRSALSNESGYLTMSDSGAWSMVGQGSLRVPMTTLDTYCAERLPGTRIDLIKIDVEGYEPNVLAGAWQTIVRWHPTIFMEFNAWNLIMQDENPVQFARTLWETFDVESDTGLRLSEPVSFTYDNTKRVVDIVLRLRSTEVLADIATSGKFLHRREELRLREEIRDLRGDMPFFSINYRLVCNSARCEKVGKSLHVTTPSQPWSYAVELPLQGQLEESGLKVAISVRVRENPVRFGILKPDGTEFIQEVEIAENATLESVELIVPANIPIGSLIVRTAARGSSIVEFEITACKLLPPAGQSERDLLPIVTHAGPIAARDGHDLPELNQ
jgi:FkbM family methyltransferase